MTDRATAEALNERGRLFSDTGDPDGAERAYLAAIVADPDWSVPAYNLGLLYKYAGRWAESREYNARAARLSPDDEAGWWNLGIAATALGDWAEARRAWTACGITPPEGDGPPEFRWGDTPVRLDPETDGEVVWATRIDPARARIVNVPLPTSRFQWGDIVLTDGAQEGTRSANGRTYPVFNVLERLVPSAYRTFIVELARADEAAIGALERLADASGGAAEHWGTATRILCYECSRGTPHEHEDGEGAPAHPHCGVAARDAEQAERIIKAWLALDPAADIITWYEAPPNEG